MTLILDFALNGFVVRFQAQCPAIRQLVMRSMADWYMRDQHEQQRLSRILDVAQDLKVGLCGVFEFRFIALINI